MLHFLFFALCALALAALFDGLRQREGILQFQALFAGTFLFSTIPQLVNYVFFPGRLPDIVYQDHGPEWAIIMCILCLLAGWLGYRRPLRKKVWPPAWMPALNTGKVFFVGFVLCIIGMCAAWEVASLYGGIKVMFITHDSAITSAQGRITIFMFLSRLLSAGLAICLLTTIGNGTFMKWLVIGIGMVYPVALAVLLGRRGHAVTIVLMVVFALWFRKRWAPPRLASVIGLLLGGLWIIVAPTFRTEMAASENNFKEGLKAAAPTENLRDYFEGVRGEGMDNLVIGIPARLKKLQFSFGALFWNDVMDNFVPAQVIGYENKDALMIPMQAEEAICLEYCGAGPTTAEGAYYTGPYSAFVEFGFFGCIIFYFMARGWKWLWTLANEQHNLAAQLWYVLLLYCIPCSVVNAVQEAFAHVVFASAIVVPVVLIAEQTRRAAKRRQVQTA